MLDRHLDRKSAANLAVVNLEGTQHDLVLRNLTVARPVLAHQDEVVGKIYSIVFREEKAWNDNTVPLFPQTLEAAKELRLPNYAPNDYELDQQRPILSLLTSEVPVIAHEEQQTRRFSSFT